MDVASARLVREDDQFWQALVPPEEDRAEYTTAPWTGGYRWFRSPNVICLERYRREPCPARQPPSNSEMSPGC
jgi:hypothetical protein